MSSLDSKTPQDQHTQNLACNVFAGSDIGYMKGINFESKSFRNLNTVEKPDKKLGISCLCWGADDESGVYAGCKGGSVIYHCLATGRTQSVQLGRDQDVQNLQEICVHDGNIISAFQNGYIDVHKIEYNDSEVEASQVDQLNSLTESDKNLLCMDHNKSIPHTFATGGKENPLRVWDINNLSADPVFVAKNVKHDWLNLRVPVWVTKAKFYPHSDKIITGTGIGKIRMYDPSTSQRRPVIEVKCEDYPVTALDVSPTSDLQVFVGNTVGTLLSVDLRKKAIVRSFKGMKGGVTDIKCHPELALFAVCSVDRYVRCYDPGKKSSVNSLYLNSSLNCVLLSSKLDNQDFTVKNMDGEHKKKASEGEDSEESADDIPDDEGEDMWNNMEVIQKKKRRLE